MRYIVIKHKNSEPFVAIWSRSQYRIEISPNITRECSHTDYLKRNNIPLADVSSIGMVYCDIRTGVREVLPSDWETQTPKEDRALVQNAAVTFCKEHPDLKEEIQYDWREHKAWEKRYKELVAARR